MKVIIHSPLRDLFSFLLHMKKRKRIFRKASTKAISKGNMNILASRLHPELQNLKILSLKKENYNTITYRLVPLDDKKIAYFRAGQYLSIDFEMDGVFTTRSYSISSPPNDSYRDNYYDLTIKTENDGFVTPYILANWQPESIIQASEPMGYFYFEPLRDSQSLVFLAGGTGITSFKSLIPDTLEEQPQTNITLFYGVATEEDINFSEYFENIKKLYSQRLKIIYVLEKPGKNWDGETGFITKELIEKYFTDISNISFFICGPPGFQKFINEELNSLNIANKYIRQDHFNISTEKKKKNNTYAIKVLIGKELVIIQSDPNETILVALERAGLNVPSSCRTGECGWCRSKLVDGDIFISDDDDGRRNADRKFGYFHPCSSFARSDLEMVCLENPRKINRRNR